MKIHVNAFSTYVANVTLKAPRVKLKLSKVGCKKKKTIIKRLKILLHHVRHPI